jgi:hypothetical protein
LTMYLWDRCRMKRSKTYVQKPSTPARSENKTATREEVIRLQARVLELLNGPKKGSQTGAEKAAHILTAWLHGASAERTKSKKRAA